MNLYRDGNEITLAVEDGETLNSDKLESAITIATASVGVWNLFVLISPEGLNAHRNVFEGRWTVAGSVSKDGNTFLKMRFPIQNSGEGRLPELKAGRIETRGTIA